MSERLTDKVPPMICQECHMRVAPGNAYHPHLFCTLWKAYKVDPAKLLADHDWVHLPADEEPARK